MEFEQNVGGIDRLLRGVLGIVLLGVAVGATIAGRRPIGLVAAIGSIGLLFNVATQFCGMNALLGIDTCSRDVDP